MTVGLVVAASTAAVPGIAFGAAKTPSASVAESRSWCEEDCVLAFADSDGDGYSDLYELLSRSDPNDDTVVPADARSERLLLDGQLVFVSVGVGDDHIVLTAPPFLYDVDITTRPDGAAAIQTTLVGADGQPLKTNTYGIDVASAGVDGKALAAAYLADPSSAGGAALKPPTETPTRPTDDKDLYSDDEDDPDKTDKGDPPATEPDKPSEDPDVAGGNPKDKKTDEQKWREQTTCKEGDDCTKVKKPEVQPPPKNQNPTHGCSLLDKGCKDYSDPDAGGGSGSTPKLLSPTPDQQAPGDPKAGTAPIHINPDDTEHEPLSAPPGTATGADPNLIHTTGDDTETFANPSGTAPPSGPGGIVAPKDPPSPDIETGVLPTTNPGAQGGSPSGDPLP